MNIFAERKYIRSAKNLRQYLISQGLCILQKDKLSIKATYMYESNRKFPL